MTGVLFDLDGTLLDTAADFVGVVREQCARHALPAPSDQLIRNTVSDGARALISLAFKQQETDPGFEDLRQELLNIYEQQLGDATVLFDGMQNVLNLIGDLDLQWGVVTNKPRRFAAPLMDRMNLSPKPAVLICPDDVTDTKPHPEPLLKAATTIGVSAVNCLYIGDHVRDIEAGRNAGMTTVAAAYGYVENNVVAQSWSADYLVTTAHELIPLIDQFHRASSRQTV